MVGLWCDAYCCRMSARRGDFKRVPGINPSLRGVYGENGMFAVLRAGFIVLGGHRLKSAAPRRAFAVVSRPSMMVACGSYSLPNSSSA